MKTYKIYLVISAILLNIACNDFIDKQPLSDFADEGNVETTVKSKYTNAEDAITELNGAYSKFKQDIFQLENYIIGDIQSDNCYLGSDEVPGAQYDNMTINALNSKVALQWAQYFGMAGTATNVIENTRLMEEGKIQENQRNLIMSEAKFIRAFAYFDIVRLWGEAPLSLKLLPPITAENLDEVYPLYYPEKSSVDTIYKAIVSDLETAIPYLPSINKGAFQATKGAAYALLAKVIATRGPKASRDYSKVVDLCNKTISEGYTLVNEYESLWAPENKFTSEAIFEVYYDTQYPNWSYWVLLKEADGSVTWRRYCTPTSEFLAKYERNDLRKNSSWIWKSVPYEVYYPANNYPLAYKIREKNSNIILIRLADVILLKAEALVELNKIKEAMELVKQIRTRAGLTALASNVSQQEARLIVEKERQLELVLEGQRWYDLIRNERMVEVMSNHKDQKGDLFIKNVQLFRTLLPIPQGEIDKNEKLTQNPGY